MSDEQTISTTVRNDEIVELFLGMADSEDMRRFLRHRPNSKALPHELPGERVSPRQVAEAIVDALARRGLIDRALFVDLCVYLPDSRRTITATAARFGIGVTDQEVDERAATWPAAARPLSRRAPPTLAEQMYRRIHGTTIGFDALQARRLRVGHVLVLLSWSVVSYWNTLTMHRMREAPPEFVVGAAPSGGLLLIAEATFCLLLFAVLVLFVRWALRRRALGCAGVCGCGRALVSTASHSPWTARLAWVPYFLGRYLPVAIAGLCLAPELAEVPFLLIVAALSLLDYAIGWKAFTDRIYPLFHDVGLVTETAPGGAREGTER